MKRSRLKADPEKTQDWQRRSAARAAENAREKPRAPLKPSAGRSVKRGGRRTSEKNAKGWKPRVFGLRGHLCGCCGKPAVQAHHIVPRHVIVTAPHLSAAQRDELAYDKRNGFPICLRCHERHETATQRVLRSCLHPDAIAWAEEHGFGWYVDDERIYPRVPPAHARRAS